VTEAAHARTLVGADLDEPAQSVGFLRIHGDIAGLDGRHLPDGLLRKIAFPPIDAAIEEHPAEPPQVAGRGEQAAGGFGKMVGIIRNLAHTKIG